MKTNPTTAFDFVDDEEGVAPSAARLGPDGGPLARARVSYAATQASVAEDDAWLDEELSDEELAALGADDFDDEELLAEDLDYVDEAPRLAAPAKIARQAPAPAPDFDPVEDELDYPEEAMAPLTQEVALASAASTEVAPAFEGSGDDLDHRPVPRISIHAFCETPATSGLLERAAVDRRLLKTHMTMHMGGLPKAIEHFQTSATPNLIIVETVDSTKQLFAQLTELAEVCDPSTKVILIGRVNDIGLYRELVRQGISEYIVNPKSPLQIIKSIAALYVDPSAPPIGKTIAFVGARGGVGSSTLAHNVAWCIAEEFKSDTVILDLDLPFGTASLDFEQDPTSGLIEALSAPERLDDVLLDRLLQKHTDRLSLFTAPNLLDRDYELDEQAFETVIDVVRGAAPTIVIDVPHIWTAWSKRILQTADEIVITATSDLAAFRNTKSLVDVISGSRPNDSPPKLVINQFDPKLSSVQPAQYAEHVGLKPSVIFGWEPQLFHTAATNASPILQVGPKTKSAQGLRDLASLVLGRLEPPKKASRFKISGLLSKR